MSDIVTRCPQCKTAFRVTPNQLAVANGMVRCGSCLSVFKALDHDITAPASQQPQPSTTPPPVADKPKTEPEQPTEPLGQFNVAEELISDQDEGAGLELDDDIYDLDTSSQNQKTSLFDRKLKPITEHTRESADESWALDMLADLEDDDEIEPIIIKRKPQPAEADEPDAPAASSLSVDEPTIDESTVDQADERQPKWADDLSLAIDNPVITATQDEDIDYLDDHLDENFDSHADTALESKQDWEESAHELGADLDADIEHYTEHHDTNENDADALYFDHDVTVDAEPVDEDKPSRSASISDEAISDAAIEDAMHSRTNYASESRAYLAGIEPAPVEMEWLESANTRRWLWLAGAVVAALVLLLQVAIHRFDTLSKDPHYRPFYATACQLFGCQLPDLLAPDKIRTTNLVVRSHPTEANALVIDAILINTAPFEQPYPQLRLEFSDINNRLIAGRSLQPTDYLRGELAGATQMPANQPVQLSLSIVDPGAAAVNYQLTVNND